MENVLTGSLIADDQNIIINHHSYREPGLHLQRQTVEAYRGTPAGSETSQTFPHHQETPTTGSGPGKSWIQTEEEEEEEEAGNEEKFRLSSDESTARD